MSDVELAAMTALLNSETAQCNHQIQHGDGLLQDPHSETRQALYAELDRRGCFTEPTR